MTIRVAYPSQMIAEKEFSWLKDLFLVVMGSIMIALCGPFSLKLPFTPIPIALTPHMCLILGAILGKNRAALAVLTYLAQGAMCLPVFALGGSGIAYLLGPRGGYLLGFVAAAYLAGYLIEKSKEKSSYKTFVSLLAGNIVIYLLGVSHLSLFIGVKSAFLLGVLPFLIGDFFKLLIVFRSVKWFYTDSSGCFGI